MCLVRVFLAWVAVVLSGQAATLGTVINITYSPTSMPLSYTFITTITIPS